MLLINLVIIFYFTLYLVFLLLINEIDQIFVKFDIHRTYRGSFVFQSVFVFFPLLAGRFQRKTEGKNKT
jgi:hypothetical protein